MINYKLKNLTQFNLNCELAMKYLRKIYNVEYMKTGIADFYRLLFPYNSNTKLQLGQLRIFESKTGTRISIEIVQSNFSTLAIKEIDLHELVLLRTDEALQEIVDFLNKNINFEVGE